MRRKLKTEKYQNHENLKKDLKKIKISRRDFVVLNIWPIFSSFIWKTEMSAKPSLSFASEWLHFPRCAKLHRMEKRWESAMWVRTMKGTHSETSGSQWFYFKIPNAIKVKIYLPETQTLLSRKDLFDPVVPALLHSLLCGVVVARCCYPHAKSSTW